MNLQPFANTPFNSVPFLFLVWFGAYVLTEVISDIKKKSPLWLWHQLLETARRFFWGELRYLRSLKNDPLLKASAAQDLALLTVKAHVIGEKKGPMPLLNLLKDYVTQPQRVLVLGKPGSGKTTILEALTYHLAQRAYHKQMIV